MQLCHQCLKNQGTQVHELLLAVPVLFLSAARLLIFPCSSSLSSKSNLQLHQHHSDGGLPQRRDHGQKDGSDKDFLQRQGSINDTKKYSLQNSVFHPLRHVIWTLQFLRNLSRTQGEAVLLGASQKPSTLLTLGSSRGPCQDDVDFRFCDSRAARSNIQQPSTCISLLQPKPQAQDFGQQN